MCLQHCDFTRKNDSELNNNKEEDFSISRKTYLTKGFQFLPVSDLEQ